MPGTIERRFKDFILESIKSEARYRTQYLGEYKESNGDETYKIGRISRGVDSIVKIQFTPTWIYILGYRTETGDVSVPVTYPAYPHRIYLPNLEPKGDDRLEQVREEIIRALSQTRTAGDLKSGV